MRRGVGRNVSVGSHEQASQNYGRHDVPMPVASAQAQAESRALIARFFIDLRQALRLTVPQAAYYLSVQPEVVEALETGQVEYLPPWPETSAIIMTYTSMAGVNGRPVLNALGPLFKQLSVRAAPQPHMSMAMLPAPQPSQYFEQPATQQFYGQQPYGMAPQYAPPQGSMPVQRTQQPFPPRPMPPQPVGVPAREPDIARSGLAISSRNLLRAGSAIASGARRLPTQALNRVRERPQRALYALSLPLGLLVILMHSSIYGTISEPFGKAVRWVSSYMQEHYGPVRDGMRYIEVDDPESRKADKLQIGGGSY